MRHSRGQSPRDQRGGWLSRHQGLPGQLLRCAPTRRRVSPSTTTNAIDVVISLTSRTSDPLARFPSARRDSLAMLVDLKFQFQNIEVLEYLYGSDLATTLICALRCMLQFSIPAARLTCGFTLLRGTDGILCVTDRDSLQRDIAVSQSDVTSLSRGVLNGWLIGRHRLTLHPAQRSEVGERVSIATPHMREPLMIRNPGWRGFTRLRL